MTRAASRSLNESEHRRKCAFGPRVSTIIKLIGLPDFFVRVVALAAIVLASCRNDATDLERLVKEVSPSGVKVLLVGIDGAAFRVLKPLVADDRLPTFERLLANGAHGILKSETPMLSPAIWTTIVTGKDRQQHGILRFRDWSERTIGEQFTLTQRQRLRLLSSNDRKVLSLWNISSPFGISNGWIAFWCTWPAEPSNGWIISDRTAVSRWTEWSGGVKSSNATYPEALLAEVRPLILDPRNPPMAEVDRLVEFSAGERREFIAAEKPMIKHRPSVFKFAYCAQRSYEEIALYMLDHYPQPDLMGVFLIANDPICHSYWHFYRPEDFRGVDPEQAKRLGKLIPNFYAHNDRYLAKLLSMVDRRTVVIIVSDHGFRSSGRLPDMRPREDQVAKNQSGMHHLDGVFIACGGPIVRGATTTAGIRDVTPTILALLGLPIAKDMPGRVLSEIIDPNFLSKYPIRQIDTYEGLINRQRVSEGSDAGVQAITDQLRALGYIGDDGEAGSNGQEAKREE